MRSTSPRSTTPPTPKARNAPTNTLPAPFSVPHAAPSRRSISIVPQVIGNLFGHVPIAVSRYESSQLRQIIRQLAATEHYDSIVCDFLAAAPNIPDLSEAVLFQHNVETTIWQRHAEQAASPLKKLYAQLQAQKMEAYERHICRKSRHVIAVSEIDAFRMHRMFGIDSVTSVPTGVDVDYFAPPPSTPQTSDIVFCGSMDWLPNTDAVLYFMSEILPLIRAQIPGATFTIAGRSPEASVVKAAQALPGVTVTGKVDDMRPYLWGSKISVVPIRIGGGTRLKIYECFAAGLPTVSTTVGAEGLRYTESPQEKADILIADQPAVLRRRLHPPSPRRGSTPVNRPQCPPPRAERALLGRGLPRLRGHPHQQPASPRGRERLT